MNEMLRLGRAFLLLNNCFTSTFTTALESAVKSCTVCCQIFMLRKQCCQLLVSCCLFQAVTYVHQLYVKKSALFIDWERTFFFFHYKTFILMTWKKKKWNRPSWGVTKHTRVRPDVIFHEVGKTIWFNTKKWSLRWHASHGHTPDK